MDLMLIRHAEAGERDPAKYPDDGLRPITPEGRRKMVQMAGVMKKMGLRFDFLVSSPLVRALQTAEVLAEVFEHTEGPQTSDVLGLSCTAAGIVNLLGKYPPDSAVALVGHEPSFSASAGALIGAGRNVQIVLKKGGTIGLAFEGAPEVGTGALAFHLKPGHLKRLAK